MRLTTEIIEACGESIQRLKRFVRRSVLCGIGRSGLKTLMTTIIKNNGQISRGS